VLVLILSRLKTIVLVLHFRATAQRNDRVLGLDHTDLDLDHTGHIIQGNRPVFEGRIVVLGQGLVRSGIIVTNTTCYKLAFVICLQFFL